MRRLRRYACGLACLVTVIALVGCGQATGRKAVDLKPIPDVKSLKVGSTHTVSLVGTFSGEKLTYSTKSSNEAVATAKVDGVHLTVTGVGAGKATITVTAADPQKRSAKDEFTVTVPKPAAPDTMEIQDFTFGQEQTPRTIPLGDKFSGANLTYRAESSNERVATVAVAAATLTVTAVGPGTATITVTATAQGSEPQTKTFTVTVPQPANEEEAPTVKDDASDEVEFDAGETTEIINLSTVFDGDDLKFSETSDDSTVATANISGTTLTITAVGPGSATITVTATNAGGSEEHEITVTVPEPDEGEDPGAQTPQPSATCKYPPAVRVTIELGRPKPCTIPKLHTLNPDSDGVTVREDLSDKTGTVWLVRAEKKGTHDITVHDGSGRPLPSKITVVVPNSAPYLSLDTEPTIQLTGASGHHTVVTRELVGSDTSFHDYFSDPDMGDVEPFIYRIVDQPKWVLIETKDGFVVTKMVPTLPDTKIKSATTQLYMEVLNKMKNDSTFTVSLVASDGSDESEIPVVLTFQAEEELLPRKVDYTSTQTENGALGKAALEVGPRRGVEHTLQFTKYDSVNGFKFVSDLTTGPTSRLNTKRLPNGAVSSDAALFYKAGIAVRNSAGPLPNQKDDATRWVPGYHYYVLESSSAVEEPRWADDSAALPSVPMVTFKLKESGSSGRITISYYVVYATSDYSLTNTSPATATSPTLIGSKSLSVTVVTCSSPPDPIKKCPLPPTS